ncbi:DMT family transporter [Iamia sp. SCSIO 61187]|uniref:DMT family transporter n=1 Tax=Iamia sp. SCSIO 61187 TaxID=2722752 RepID=UPI001C63ACDC|nr:DMT family transporter [Iamia sp. SCSIO 61187]QYG95240.1 DMT family transporter [Iamia sp. SCSIO 61187]
MAASEAARDAARATARPSRVVVVGVLAVGIVAVSASALITREAYDATGGGSTGRGLLIALSRLALAAALTLPAWRTRGDAPAVTRLLPPGTGGRAVAGGVLLGLHFGTWLPSLAFTSIAASTTIVTTVPVWVVLLVWAARGQRPSARTGVGIAIAIGGGALVALGDVDGLDAGSNPLLGNVLALAAAVTYSAHLLLGQEVQARGLGIWRWTTVVTTVGAVALVPLVVATAPGEGPFPLRFWVAVVALCVVSQLVGHSSLTWSTQWISPTLVSVAILLEPVLASAGAAALYDEVPGGLVLLGAAVLVVGVGLTTLAERPSDPTPADEPVRAP